MKSFILMLILTVPFLSLMSQKLPAKQPCCNLCGNLGFGVWGDCGCNGNITEYFPVADVHPVKEGQFGSSVSVAGNYAIIGAPGDNIGTHTKQGSASIYRFNGTFWVLMQKLTDAAGITNELYGVSVSISGNYAIVGAIAKTVGTNVNQGAAFIYHTNGTTWALMQELTDGTGGAGDFFGAGVSISGSYAVIGTFGSDEGGNADQGSASFYRFNGASWVLVDKLTNDHGAAGDRFGSSVSISGNYAIIGAPKDTEGTLHTNEGSASMYHYNGSHWIFVNKVTDGNATSNADFGISVSISGNYAVVGAADDDLALIHGGSASIFYNNGSYWEGIQKLSNVNGEVQDRMGASVFISGNYIIVGAPHLHPVDPGGEQGASFIYQRIGLGWQRLQYVTDPGANPFDSFGSGVVVDRVSKRFLIGADGFANFSGKVLFGKIN